MKELAGMNQTDRVYRHNDKRMWGKKELLMSGKMRGLVIAPHDP